MWRFSIGAFLAGAIACGPVLTAFADPQSAAPMAPPPATAQQPVPTYKLPPVIVTSTRTGISPENATTYVTVLTHQDIKQSPQLVLDDLLRQVTGFNTFRRSSSIVTAPADDPEAQGVTLRGVGPGGASRALVLLDGIPVNDAFGGWIYWDEIPLNSIDRIEVVEGGGSNLWGNEAEGGVIDIISKRPSESNGVDVLGSYGIRNTTLCCCCSLSLSQDAAIVNFNKGPIRGMLEGDFFNTNGWNIVQSNFRGPIDGTSSSINELFAGRVAIQSGHRIVVVPARQFLQ